MLNTRKKLSIATVYLLFLTALTALGCSNSTAGKDGLLTGGLITPTDGKLEIPVAGVNDGKAHHFQVKTEDGTMVTFFVLKSADGVLRAAIDACDVCYRSG
ncbi:MAG: Fe-S-containing protein, partial [Desulfobulbales bacterium]|nr:Fe-S-containing protein [Desulfobulbales bacterium]